MPELDQQYLQQQQVLLQEIRDELRASRGGMQSGGMGGASSGAARPGHTFVAAQAAADRTLCGEWSSFGWAQAYSPTYKSTIMGDLGAIIGFRRAPETMTQQEFQGIAGQSIAARVGSAALGFVAPEYNSRTNALADDIYQNSSRFIRFGSSNAGVMGSGFDMNVARSISRSVQHEALGDLRLSGRDYNTITSLGMQSGQFDQTGNVDDFKKKVRELASATGDLTRALHMTVTEVGTAMGNLRQMGVTNVAQQRGIMMQVGGSAMVAGMSSPEMMQFAGGIAQQGLSMGLSAQTTMPAAASTMAMVRSLSQSGILSPSVMAMGGGAAGIAGQIMHAEMGFSASQGGYLSLLGGGGRAGMNSFDAMINGLGAAGVGTFEGAMTMQMDRVSNMSKVTPQQLENNMRNMFESRMSLTGISDFTSRSAQGMGFQMARAQGMDEAAALAFSQSNFSVDGRRASDLAKIQEGRATGSREHAVALDKWQSQSSMQGRFRSGIQNIEAGFANILDGGMAALDRWNINGGDKFLAGANNAVMGVSDGGPLDAETIDMALSSRSINTDPTNPTTLHIRNHDVSTGRALAAGVGGLGLAAGAAWGMAAIGAANAWNPLGWGLLATAGVGLAAGALGSYLGAEFNKDGETVVSGTGVSELLQTQRGIIGANGTSAAAKKNISGNTLKGKAWEQLTSQFDRSKMNGDDLKRFSDLVNVAAADNGLKGGSQEVIDTLVGMGAVIAPADMAEVGANGMNDAQTQAVKDLLSGQDAVGTITTAKGSKALGAYIDNALAGKGVDAEVFKAAKAAFGDAGAFDKFQKSVKGNLDDTERRGKLEAAAQGFKLVAGTIAVSEFNGTMKGAAGLAESLLGSSDIKDDDRNAALKEIASLNDKENKLTFTDLLSRGKLHDLAASGALHSDLLQTAAGVTDESLAGKSADEIASLYHINPSGLADFMNDPAKRGNLKTIVQASILGGQAVAREQQAAAPMIEANLLNRTASMLDQFAAKYIDPPSAKK